MSELKEFTLDNTAPITGNTEVVNNDLPIFKLPDTGNPPVNTDGNEENDFMRRFKEYAAQKNYEVPNDINIQTEVDLLDTIGEYKLQERFGKDNPVLQLAEKNIDIGAVAQQMSQYDALLGNDDKEFFLQAKAIETVEALQKTNPDIEQSRLQDAFQESYKALSEKYKDTKDDLFQDLGKPYRQTYNEKKKNLIPNQLEYRQKVEAENQAKIIETQKANREFAANNRSYIGKDNSDYNQYLESNLSVKDGKIPFMDKLKNQEFLSKMVELSYLLEKGQLSETIAKKAIGGGGKSTLFNNASAPKSGIKIIETWNPH